MGCAPHAASGRALDPLSTRSGGRGWVQGGTLPNVRNFGEAEILRKCALVTFCDFGTCQVEHQKGRAGGRGRRRFLPPERRKARLVVSAYGQKQRGVPMGRKGTRAHLSKISLRSILRCALRAKATAEAEGERPPSEADVYSLRFPLESCSPAPPGRVNPRACRPAETGGIGLRPSAS